MSAEQQRLMTSSITAKEIVSQFFRQEKEGKPNDAAINMMIEDINTWSKELWPIQIEYKYRGSNYRRKAAVSSLETGGKVVRKDKAVLSLDNESKNRPQVTLLFMIDFNSLLNNNYFNRLRQLIDGVELENNIRLQVGILYLSPTGTQIVNFNTVNSSAIMSQVLNWRKEVISQPTRLGEAGVQLNEFSATNVMSSLTQNGYKQNAPIILVHLGDFVDDRALILKNVFPSIIKCFYYATYNTNRIPAQWEL